MAVWPDTREGVRQCQSRMLPPSLERPRSRPCWSPLTRAHAPPQAVAFRCRLILRAAAPDRPSHLRLAADMGCDRHTVRLWRTRYLAHGLAGLQDAPRS